MKKLYCDASLGSFMMDHVLMNHVLMHHEEHHHELIIIMIVNGNVINKELDSQPAETRSIFWSKQLILAIEPMHTMFDTALKVEVTVYKIMILKIECPKHGFV